MAESAQRRTILMADDDGEDCALVGDALRETGHPCDLRFVRNGEELFDYLRRQGEYQQPRDAPRPDLILLDLKMPRKDGRETLQELKADPDWRQIPVVILTTSAAGDDVNSCYEMGVNAFITKPVSFRKLVRILDALTKYWFDVAQLPPKTPDG
jgi:two-component system, response regulator